MIIMFNGVLILIPFFFNHIMLRGIFLVRSGDPVIIGCSKPCIKLKLTL